MSLEDFAQVCNLPFMEEDYYQSELKGSAFNFETHVQSLLIEPTSRIPTPFDVGLIRPNSISIHYKINHVLFLRKGNYSTLQKSDVHAV